MQTYFAVMLGGGIGSALRFWLGSLVAARYGESFPVGTLVVNVVGCFIIGVFAALAGPGGPMQISPEVRHFVVAGVLGGFTTFSAFGLQTFVLALDGQWGRSALYVFLSLALCFAAVAIGHTISRLSSQ